MRIVTYLLLKQMISRTIFAYLVVSTASICLQFILDQHHSSHVAVHRGILFGSIIGGAWTTVRWRYFSGVQIVEGLGYPRWIVALILGLLSASVILAFTTITPSRGEFSMHDQVIEWQSEGVTKTIERARLNTEQQFETFDKISRALSQQNRPSMTRLFVTTVPFGLFLILLYSGRDDDLWQPILTTGITIVLIELWYQAYV